jgi:hypothetical protein
VLRSLEVRRERATESSTEATHFVDRSRFRTLRSNSYKSESSKEHIEEHVEEYLDQS